MYHRTLEEISQVAAIDTAPPLSRKAVQRQRLHRFADLLCAYTGSIRLLTRMEYLTAPELHAMRGDLSPLALAYADPKFRQAGLAGDTVGDAMAFFDLSERQVHTLFCDCHYGPSAGGPTIAARIQAVADRLTIRERWESMRAYFSRR